MTFNDPEINSLKPRTREGLRLLLEHLCGETIEVGCTQPKGGSGDCGNCQSCMNWGVVSERLKLDTLRLEDLNDILILVDQFPVSEAFFGVFFSHDSEITFEELKAGVSAFEGFAVLLFGNVRFAYRKLKSLRRDPLLEQLQGLDRIESTIRKEDFEPRRKSLPLPAEVDKKSTWLLGYIAKNKAELEITRYAAMAVLLGREEQGTYLEGKSEPVKKLYEQFSTRLKSTDTWNRMYPDFGAVKSQVDTLQYEIQESRRRGWLNTSHYLALDYMDVYVATSMRERWEFEDVHTIANRIFLQPVLQNLNLRYFDPTQSFLENRVDKGIVEALMLKRARCTIYMAQEKNGSNAATFCSNEEKIFLDENTLHEEKMQMCEILAKAEKDLFDSRARSLQNSTVSNAFWSRYLSDDRRTRNAQ